MSSARVFFIPFIFTRAGKDPETILTRHSSDLSSNVCEIIDKAFCQLVDMFPGFVQPTDHSYQFTLKLTPPLFSTLQETRYLVVVPNLHDLQALLLELYQSMNEVVPKNTPLLIHSIHLSAVGEDEITRAEYLTETYKRRPLNNTKTQLRFLRVFESGSENDVIDFTINTNNFGAVDLREGLQRALPLWKHPEDYKYRFELLCVNCADFSYFKKTVEIYIDENVDLNQLLADLLKLAHAQIAQRCANYRVKFCKISAFSEQTAPQEPPMKRSRQ